MTMSTSSPEAYPRATDAEIQLLLKNRGKLEKVLNRSLPVLASPAQRQTKPRQTSPRAPTSSPPNLASPAPSPKPPPEYSEEALKLLRPTGQPLPFASPLHMLKVVCPELVPHAWQKEELLRLGGYLDPSDLSKRATIDEHNAFMLNLPAANGSGKDQYLIAPFAVWFALVGCRNRTIITSASHDQLKSQTAPSILYIIEAVNRLFPGTFRTVEFHYVCTLTASEIKLFATDEEGRAEGYHPWHGGRMAIIINEAKTVRMFNALRRCTGYAYWLEISSPGPKSGDFYQSSLNAVCYPALPELNHYYHRRISAYDCPHIPKAHIERMREEMTPEWFQSSILAEFSEVGESIVVTSSMLLTTRAAHVERIGEDIGIGLDLAAGGDENSCYVRKGNRVIHEFHFRQRDTTITDQQIDTELAPWKQLDYAFNADDGGIGRAIIDNLAKRGWKITRRLNQSPAYNKREFLNLGAEMYFHLRRLIMRHAIILPNEPVFNKQIVSRYYGRQDTTGKFKLESKPDSRARNKFSPDRADAFVLCFFSYRPSVVAEVAPVQSGAPKSLAQFIEQLAWNPESLKRHGNTKRARPIQHYARL